MTSTVNDSKCLTWGLISDTQGIGLRGKYNAIKQANIQVGIINDISISSNFAEPGRMSEMTH